MKSKAPNQPDFGLQYDADGMILDPHPPLSFDPDAMSSLACKTPNLEMRPMNATKPSEQKDTTFRAAVGARWEGHHYEFGIVTRSSLAEWEKRAREILRENGIPDSVPFECWTHV